MLVSEHDTALFGYLQTMIVKGVTMSMYRPYSNIAFNNCYDFIMKSKAEKEVWELSISLTFDDKEEMRWELDRISDLTRDIMNAEYDLCEMEMDALYDVEKYDAVLNGNIFRKGRNRKAKRNGKRNAEKAKRLHKADRKHGKNKYKEIIKETNGDILDTPSYKKFIDTTDEMNGSWIIMNRNKKVGRKAETLQKVTYNRKTFRNRLSSAMDAREKEDALLFTGVGELLEDINYLEDRIYIYEEDIKNLEYEKAYGYLTDRGEEFLEDYKKELEELKEYKQYKEVLLRTATR